MTQTLALLVDAYRELNARKMFWISLIISGVVIAAFALLGVNDKNLTLLTMEMPAPAPRFWYKYIFSLVVIGIWISWGAVILALISTAGIFPELISGGAIDLYLSKPISRLRLFFTKYLGGLIFVLLQSCVFAIGCYVVFGIRSGQWRGSIFLIIPLATLLFSYLFAVCVLVGVFTRSTMAALLVTIVVWLLFALSTRSEQFIFQMRVSATEQVRIHERNAKEAEAELATLKKSSSFLDALGFRQNRAKKRQEAALKNAKESREAAEKWTTAHRIARAVVTVMPKTNETIDILDRRIFDDADLKDFRKKMMGDVDAMPVHEEEMFENAERAEAARNAATENAKRVNAAHKAAATTSPTTNSTTNPATQPQDQAIEGMNDWREQRRVQIEAEEAATRAARSRSIPWVIFTSLGFEAVVLALAAWVFCRRDY